MSARIEALEEVREAFVERPAYPGYWCLCRLGSFLSRRPAPEPETKDVSRRVNVTIMMSTTPITNPVSYSKARPTFRTAVGDLPTARASLGSKRFIDLSIGDACLLAFVFQHHFEATPARIVDGLGHSGLVHPGHITNEYGLTFSHEATGRFVKPIFSPIGNLRVYCRDAFLVARSLGFGKLRFKFPIPAPVYSGAIRHRRGSLKPEIYTDFLGSCGRITRHGNGHTKIPAATRVLSEATRPKLTVRESVAIPQTKPMAREDYLSAVILNAPAFERNPTQRAVAPTASSPTQPTPSRRIPLGDIVVGGFMDSIGADKVKRMHGTDQIRIDAIGRQPLPTLQDRSARKFVRVVPDRVYFASHLSQDRSVLVLYPHSKCSDVHTDHSIKPTLKCRTRVERRALYRELAA
jgi:hypothetical protein